MMHLERESYDAQVDRQSDYLAEMAQAEADDGDDDAESLVLGLAHDSLDGHGWFQADRPGLHGQIIEYSEADPSQYTDWMGYIDGQSIERTVRTLAFVCFEADVIEAAKGKLNDA